MAGKDRVVVMIASPLESEHVERLASAYPDRVDVVYRPDLMPGLRYIGDHGDPAFQRTSQQEREWHDLLREADVLFDFPQHERLPLLELAPKLRWVQTSSAGVGPLVHRLGLQDSPLMVTTASGIHAQPLTEFVFAALLFHVKKIAQLQRDQRDKVWNRFSGDELAEKTMAIIGPGRIGRMIARIARAFGMRVVALARDADPARAEALGVDRVYGRGELLVMLGEADVLVVCAPQTPETTDLLGAEELASLKRGAVFINIGRGTIVDEAALERGLRDGQIAFAALDVFRNEPLPPESPFWEMPNVLINPHSASTADTENAKLTEIFVRNLGHYLASEFGQMAPLLDKQRMY